MLIGKRLGLITLLAILVQTCALPALAQDRSTGESQNLLLDSRWPDGPCYGVVYADSIAYYGNGGSVSIVDESDPSNPVPLSQVQVPGPVLGVDKQGDYIYAAAWTDGLRIINVSDPSDPVEVGRSVLVQYTYDVAVDGNYAFLAEYQSGLRIVDVSDPAHPVTVSQLDTPDRAHGICAANGYAYVADWNGGLRIIDVSDPSNPVEVGVYDTQNAAFHVDVADTLAYVADQFDGVRVISISDPANPYEVGFYDTPDFAWEVAVQDTLLAVADGISGVLMFSVSDPSNPTLLGSYNTDVAAYGVDIGDDHAWVADYGGGMVAVNISDPSAPTFDSQVDSGDYAEGIVTDGYYAYVAADRLGLVVLNLSNPLEIYLSSRFDTEGYVYGLALQGDLVYLADYSPGLKIVDVTDRTTPVLLSSLNIGGGARAVAVNDSIACIAASETGLVVVDISNPAAPVHLLDPAVPGDILDVTVAGGLVYTAGTEGLRICAPAGGGALTVLGSFAPAGVDTIFSVSVEGNRGVVSGGGQLYLLDLSDPAAPVVLGVTNTTRGLRSVALRDGLVWGVSHESQLDSYYSAFFTLDPADGSMVPTSEYLPTSGNVRAMALGSDGYLYLLTQSGGNVVRFDVSAPGATAQAGLVDLYGNGIALAAGNGFLLASTVAVGIYTVGLDPFEPVHDFDPGDYVEGIVMDGDLAYLSVNDAGLQIYDYSDPLAPVQRGVLAGEGIFQAVQRGDRLYIQQYFLSANDHLWTVDVSDPDAPVLLDDLTMPFDRIGELAIVGDYLYVGGLEDGYGLSCYSLADPDAPALASSIELPASPSCFAVDGDIVYAGYNRYFMNKVEVLDATEPAAPLRVGQLDCLNIPSSLRTLGDRLFVGLWGAFVDGLEVGPVQCQPTAVEDTPLAAPLLVAHPNPFNPKTRVSFALPEAAFATVSIHDVTGRHLRTLTRAMLPAGLNQLDWDGADDRGRPLASGLYFARLEAGTLHASCKLALIR